MKKLILTLVVTMAQAGWAQQICAPASPEMSSYQNQKSWRAQSVNDNSGAPAVSGYVDTMNRFYFDDLSRSGPLEAKVTIDPANTSYKYFFKYCSQNRAAYLRSMRKGNENNKYTASLRFLPSLTGFSNNPLADQKFKETKVDVRVVVSKEAMLSQEVFSDSVKARFAELIKSQVAAQPEYGLINLDLTGWDDAVCDLINDRIAIYVDRTAFSYGPLVKQEKAVDPQDIQVAYENLRQLNQDVQGKERLWFLAGRAVTKLEENRRIGSYDDKKIFEVVKRLMTPDLSRVAELERPSLNCIADQLQSYVRPKIEHIMGIQFKFPKLSDLDPEVH